MKDFTLSQQYAILGLDGIESLHSSFAKNAVIRGIFVARELEKIFENAAEDMDPDTFSKMLQESMERIRHHKKKDDQIMEKEIYACLGEAGVMTQVPDLLGCDINYYTSGVELMAYRSDVKTRWQIVDGIRAEMLEEGPVSLEPMLLLWLCRESGCIHDLFSVEEQRQIQKKMISVSAANPVYRILWESEFHRLWLCRESGCIHDLFSVEEQRQIQKKMISVSAANPVYRILWESEFHSMIENAVGNFLRAKHKLFQNPYLQGVNMIFPFIERRQAIFIDMVVFGTSVQGRREAVVQFLIEKGHYVEQVKNGSETLLKIDSFYYRIFPTTRVCQRVPIQGVNLIPVYW